MINCRVDSGFTLSGSKLRSIGLFIAAFALFCVLQPCNAYADEPNDEIYLDETTLSEILTVEEPSIESPLVSDNAVEELAYNTSRNVSLNVKGTNYATEARKVLALINAERSRHGASPLTWDTNLERSAMLRSMEISVLFAHTRPNGTSFSTASRGTSISGENIADLSKMGSRATSPTFVNTAWTNSTGHLANMVNKSYKSVGIACFNGYWVECFSRSSGSGMTSAANNESGTWNIEVGPSNFHKVFTDVRPADWYVKDGYLSFVYNNGIMSGYSNTKLFGPYDTITRGQVAVILHRAHLGDAALRTSNQVPTKFSDVSRGQYYTAAVKWANENGIVTGYSGTSRFGPNDPVTREQLATMIARYAEKMGGKNVAGASKTKFNRLVGDSRVSPWAMQSMIWCVDNNIISGVDNKYLRPQDTAWRASMAKIIMVTLTKVL